MAGRSRNRQSRLTFTPMPSSSPSAKDYNKQIQDRAAAVTLNSSRGPAKRRKLRDDDMQLDGMNDAMPTPAASHPRLREKVVEEDSESEGESEEPIRSTQRRPSTQTKRSRQQRLDFSNVRDADSFSPPMKLSSPSRPRSSARAGMFGTQAQRTVVDLSSGDSDEELPSPGKLVANRKSKKSDNTDGMGKRTRGAQAQPIAVDSESEGDNIVVVNKQPDAIEAESDDEDDDMPTTAGTQRRQKRARRKSRDSFISSSPPRMIDSDDDLEIIEQPKKRRQRDAREDEENEAESEDEPVTPFRPKLKRRRQMSQREQDDLQEDLDFLEPSSDVESPRKKRDRQSQQKNARQEALESLRRRRSKQVDEPDEGAGSGREGEGFDELYDDDDDYETQPPPMKSSQMFREDNYDQDFIEEEDEEETPLGVPDGVPLQFTRYASMKPKELFKHAVEWFVQKKINPAFQMNDGIYDLTFRKLDDEVAGLAGSKFKSSVWTPEFTMSLNSRPDIAYEPIDRTEGEHWMRDHCDACNRTNHPATYQIQFQGKPYYRETLEEVAGNDDDDDDSSSENEDGDSDNPSYDAYGRELPPESKIYYVGKFCMSNAQTAHALQHWRYHLNEWVITWLNRNGYNAPNKVVERDGWNTKKRQKYANKIADRLEREGVVKQLYKDYRSNINEARDSKQGRYGSWD